MRNKWFRYLIAILLIAFLGFKSVYFKKLDEVKSKSAAGGFNSGTFAKNLYKDRLLPRADSAIDLSLLISLLKTDPQKAFKEYSHALAIGNIRYFLVRGEGTITDIAESNISVLLKDEAEKTQVSIATEFVYGNSIRDASGLVSLNDFNNTNEINSISESINSIIRKEVLPPFIATAKTGVGVRFAGAIELNQKYLDLETIEVIPIRLTVLE